MLKVFHQVDHLQKFVKVYFIELHLTNTLKSYKELYIIKLLSADYQIKLI